MTRPEAPKCLRLRVECDEARGRARYVLRLLVEQYESARSNPKRLAREIGFDGVASAAVEEV